MVKLPSEFEFPFKVTVTPPRDSTVKSPFHTAIGFAAAQALLAQSMKATANIAVLVILPIVIFIVCSFFVKL